MCSKSIHDYMAFEKVFEYNTNTCIHNFYDYWIHTNTKKMQLNTDEYEY